MVDDSRLYREGLVELLSAGLGRGAVGSAASLSALEQLLAELPPDRPEVVVVNLAAARSNEILRTVEQLRAAAKVVAVGVDENDEGQVIGCAEAGVSGYLTREDSLADLISVIRNVSEGGTRVSQRISAMLLRRVRELAPERTTPARLEVLTDREIQILRLIGVGMSNRAIAEELTIELHTVKNHVHSMLAKLGVSGRGEAAALLRDGDASTPFRETARISHAAAVRVSRRSGPGLDAGPQLDRGIHARPGGGGAS
ncbi:response regulator transcription factor [Nocardioides sp. GY 10113]|uniref:LuxR C-terminal-related transcriptional regulator n=1 Tax=Nocardioides sp. GY 10113 TaxID=2569761 RepID=UPI001458355E|nr:response regulator transcription factor [Nocardioides sp. GY 10113]